MSLNFEPTSDNNTRQQNQAEWSKLTSHILTTEGAQRGRETMLSLSNTADRATLAEQEQRYGEVADLWLSQIQARSASNSPADETIILMCKLELGKALVKSGDLLRGHHIILDSIEKIEQSKSPVPGELILTALRTAMDAQLLARDIAGVVQNLSLAALLTEKFHGATSSHAAELAFERVLALEALRATDEPLAADRYSEIANAISDACNLIRLKQCNLSSHRKGELLLTLGERQFNYANWDEARIILEAGLAFVSHNPKVAKTILILAQIAAYQERPQEAHRHLRFLELRPHLLTPEVSLAIKQLYHIINGTTEPSETPRGGSPSDSPGLRCIKDYLVRGYLLLQDNRPVAAQSVLEGAGALISHQYHAKHILWSKAHILLARAFADRAEECCDDRRTCRSLLREAQQHSLNALEIMTSQRVAQEDQRVALTLTIKLSEALGDTELTAKLRRQFDSNGY